MNEFIVKFLSVYALWLILLTLIFLANIKNLIERSGGKIFEYFMTVFIISFFFAIPIMLIAAAIKIITSVF